MLNSSVAVQVLDSNLAPTGQTFATFTTDDQGDFAIPNNVPAGYVEVIASGFYFDELTNALSSAPLTLRTLAYLTSGHSGTGTDDGGDAGATAATVNVNLLTSIADPLTRALVGQGVPFAQAVTRAQTEVLTACGFSPSLISSFVGTAITGSTTASAALLAASLIIEQYARSLGPSEVAQLTQLLAQIGAQTDDAGENSVLAGLQAELCTTAVSIDVTSVRSSLTSYYASLGASVTIPAFEPFITEQQEAGTCVGGCLIGGVYYPPGATGSGACQVCAPSVSTTAWTDSCLITIASYPDAENVVLYGIAVRGTRVYWTLVVDDAGSHVSAVLSAPVGGGTPTTLASDGPTGGNAPCGPAVDDTNVYWADSNLMKAPLDGGAATTLVANVTPVGEVVVDSTRVYWTETSAPNPDGGSPIGVVLSLPLDGGMPLTLATGDTPAGLAVNQTDVYWTDYFGGTLARVAVGGGPTTTLAAGLQFPNSPALDSTSVYWTEVLSGGAAVVKMPIGGGPTVTIASGQGQGSLGGLAVDAANVYWTTGSNVPGAVMAAPIDGGAAMTLVVQNRPEWVTMDATSLYWVNWGNTGIDYTVMQLTPK